MKLAFDWLSREIIRFALKQKGALEYSIHGIMSLHKGCKPAVSVEMKYSDLFSGKIGVHQGSVLIPQCSLLILIFWHSHNKYESSQIKIVF